MVYIKSVDEINEYLFKLAQGGDVKLYRKISLLIKKDKAKIEKVKNEMLTIWEKESTAKGISDFSKWLNGAGKARYNEKLAALELNTTARLAKVNEIIKDVPSPPSKPLVSKAAIKPRVTVQRTSSRTVARAIPAVSKKAATTAAKRHQQYIMSNYGSNVTGQLRSFVKDLRNNAAKSLETMPDGASKIRLQRLNMELTQYAKALTKDMNSEVKGSLTALAKYESKFTERLLKQNIPNTPFETAMPTTYQLKSAAFTNILDKTIGSGKNKAYTIQDALSKFGSETSGRIIREIRQGYAAGTPTRDIAKAMRETADNLGEAQSLTLARTITNHTASTARHEFYKENEDIITEYEVVVTNDDRLSDICEELDGKRFSKEEFVPPPYHFGCRSTFIGVIDEKYAIKFD